MPFGYGSKGDGEPDIKVSEDMNENLCKKVDGKALPLKNGGTACVFARDPESREPIDINLENITPDVREEIKRETGKELK